MLYDWLRSQSPDDPATTEYDAWKGYIWGSRVGWDPNANAVAAAATAAAAAAASSAAATGGSGGGDGGGGGGGGIGGAAVPDAATTSSPSLPPPGAGSAGSGTGAGSTPSSSAATAVVVEPPPPNPANNTLFASSIRLTFVELPIIGDTSLPFKEGIKLQRLWESWHGEALRTTAECGSEEVTRASGFQTASEPGWAFFDTQKELLYEKDFLPVIIMLTMVAGSAAVLWNWWMAILVVGMGALNQILAYGFMGMIGWNMGMVEGITVLALPAVSVDFVCLVAQAYMDAAADVDTDQPMEDQQADRVVMALTYSGVTVVESVATHLLAAAPMFLSNIEPTFRSNAIIYYITFASCFSSLFLFPILLSFVGPTGTFGSLNFFSTVPQKKQELIEEERRLLRARAGGGAHLRRQGVLTTMLARLFGAGGGKKAKKIEPAREEIH